MVDERGGSRYNCDIKSSHAVAESFFYTGHHASLYKPHQQQNETLRPESHVSCPSHDIFGEPLSAFILQLQDLGEESLHSRERGGNCHSM